MSSPALLKQQLSLVRTRLLLVPCPRLVMQLRRKGVRSQGIRPKVFLLALHLLLHLMQPLQQVLQLKSAEVSKNPSLEKGSIQSPPKRRRTEQTSPALQFVRTKRSKQLRRTSKWLRPSLRVQVLMIKEEWDNREATSLPVTTGGHTRTRSPLPSLVLPGLHR